MTDDTPAEHPPGEYAIVEIMGHVTLVGRIAEVTRFGTAMLAIEPIFRGELLPMVFQSGASIYRLTPCSPETAFARAPKHSYQLPAPILNIVPPLLLEAAATDRTIRDVGIDDDDIEDDDGR